MHRLALVLLLTTGAALAQVPNVLTGYWLLETLSPGLDGAPMQGVNLQISGDGQVRGSGGCNRLMGQVESPAEGRIGFRIGTTLMGCAPEIMQVEQAFLKALNTARSYALDGDVMTLRDASGEALAQLRHHVPD